MPRANTIQTNFTSGEVSPLMRGRVDINRYFNGAQLLRNFLCLPQGGIRRRSGSRFINATKTQTKRSRLIPFRFSTVQAYMLEFGDQYIRIYRNGGVVESAPSVPAEVTTPYLEADLAQLKYAQSADVLYITHPSYQTRKLTRTSHTSWSISTFTTKDGPYLAVNSDITKTMKLSSVTDAATMTASGGTPFVVGDVGKYVSYKEDNEWRLALITAYTSSTVVTVDVIDAIKTGTDGVVKLESDFTQTFQLTSTHSDVWSGDDIGKYVRLADGTWHQITDWKPENNKAKTNSATNAGVTQVVLGAATVIVTGRTITATLTANHNAFVSTDTSRQFRLDFSADQVWGTISAYSSATVVTVTLDGEPPLDPSDNTKISNNGLTDVWRLGAWSVTTGWPGAVTFHEQRLVFSRTTTEPQTKWLSRPDDYTNFAPTELDSEVLDDNAVTYTIVSNQVNAIEWLISGPVLLSGTIGGEWQSRAATSLSEPITPTNISVTPQTTWGSEPNLSAVRIGSAIAFCQRGGRKIREMAYSFELDSYVSKDLTIISEHILREGTKAVDMAYQQTPHSILWIARTDGLLVAMTYDKDQEVVAWHVHELGANASGAVVESVAVIPSNDATEDSVYLIVKRTIGGATKRYVERLETDFLPDDEDDKDGCFFVDCGLPYSGSATTTFGGLTHLEGETVAVFADGEYMGTKTVASGSVTIGKSAITGCVGYNYNSDVFTMPVEGGSAFGTAQGKTKRVTQITLRLLDSIGISYGTSTDDLRELSFRATSDPMDVTPPLFTGDKTDLPIEKGWVNSFQLYLRQSKPLPLTILAIMLEVTTND